MLTNHQNKSPLDVKLHLLYYKVCPHCLSVGGFSSFHITLAQAAVGLQVSSDVAKIRVLYCVRRARRNFPSLPDEGVNSGLMSNCTVRVKHPSEISFLWRGFKNAR